MKEFIVGQRNFIGYVLGGILGFAIIKVIYLYARNLYEKFKDGEF